MKVTGVIRARNAAKWIAEVIDSMLWICANVLVMNDHSTDDTADIVNGTARATAITSPFTSLNEARDRTFLTRAAIHAHAPDWILMLDADEVLLEPFSLQYQLHLGGAQAYALQILTLWDTPDQIRVDGIYGDLWRPSVFSAHETSGVWTERVPGGTNLHCGSIPSDLVNQAVRCEPPVRVKHYGSMLQADRLRKYAWYLEHDAANLENEDHYRHAIQGDLAEFPADAVYRHGGPLKLQHWSLDV
jgi:glycosyltransferase involved in cell wall biosynthesis